MFASLIPALVLEETEFGENNPALKLAFQALLGGSFIILSVFRLFNIEKLK